MLPISWLSNSTIFGTNSCPFIFFVKVYSIFWHKFMLLYHWLSNSTIFWHKLMFLYLLQSKLWYFGTKFNSFCCQTSVFGTNSCSYILDCQTIFWQKFMFLYILLSNFSFWHKFMFLYLLLSNYIILAEARAMWKKPTKSSRCQYGQVAWHPWKTWTKYTITQYKNK